MKDTVQRDGTEIKTRLKNLQRKIIIQLRFIFFALKGRHLERNMKPVSASEQKFIKVDGSLSHIPVKGQPRCFNSRSFSPVSN